MAAIHFSKDSLRIGLFSILQSFTCTFCSESLAPTRRNRWLSILGMVGSQLAERLASKLGTVFLLARNNQYVEGQFSSGGNNRQAHNIRKYEKDHYQSQNALLGILRHLFLSI